MREKHPAFFLPDQIARFLDWLLVRMTVEGGKKVDKAEVIRELIRTHPEFKQWSEKD